MRKLFESADEPRCASTVRCMKIAVIGAGYVGAALAVLLSQSHEVAVLDIDATRVECLNQRRPPIEDDDLAEFLRRGDLDLRATTSAASALAGARFAIIATPTDYDEHTGSFDTSAVEAAAAHVARWAPAATIVVRSTVPVGYTGDLARRTGLRVLFSPEFLREGRALHDNLHPSRIIVSPDVPAAREFGGLLAELSADADVPVRYMASAEAESVKLFANTYLALRVAFHNELDTYAAAHGLDSRSIIEGVGLDPRIGTHYNNPSFGYGGYCLPKDTRQLLATYDDLPQTLIRAVVDSNDVRMDFIASEILARGPAVVGIHRLAMKAGSDNFRSSSVQGVMRRLVARGCRVIVYEPLLDESQFAGAPVVRGLAAFKALSDVIVANRVTDDLSDVPAKIYTRDLFGAD